MLLSWALHVLHGQTNVTTHYTVADGLPITETTTVFADRAGRIWTAHLTGDATWYDGRRFHVFPITETGVQPLHFREDARGVWALDQYKAVARYASGRWKTYPAPDILFIETDRGRDEIVGIDTSGRILRLDTLTGQWRTAGQVPATAPGKSFFVAYSPLLDRYLFLEHQRENTRTVLSAYTSPSLIDPTYTRRPDLETGFMISQARFKWEGLDFVPPPESRDIYAELHNIPFLQVTGDHLLFYTLTPNADKRTYRITIFRIEAGARAERIAAFDSHEYIVRFAMDRTGQLWAASGSGLERIDPARLQFTEDMPGMAVSLHALNEDDQGRIWFGGYSSGLSYYDGTAIRKADGPIGRILDILPGSYRNSAGQMAFWSERKGLLFYDRGRWIDVPPNTGGKDNITGFFFRTLSGGRVAAGLAGHGLGLTAAPLRPDPQWTFIGPDKGMHLYNVLTISEDKKGRLWLGRPSQGLAVYDPILDTARTWLREGIRDSIGFGAISSCIDDRGRLWLGCHDGLRVIEDPAGFDLHAGDLASAVRPIRLIEAGPSRVSSVAQAGHYLVFGNQLGYGFLDLNTVDAAPDQPAVYFTRTGQSGGPVEQNTILLDSKGLIWVGLDKGVVAIDPARMRHDTFPAHIIVSGISIRGGGQDTFIEGRGGMSFRLPMHQRSGTLHVTTSFSPHLLDNSGYQYRFLQPGSRDTLWSDYSASGDIRFDFLPAGRNIIEIRTIKNNQVHDRISVVVAVPRTLQESPLFWAGLATLLALIMLGIVVTVFRSRMRLRAMAYSLSEQVREKQQFQIQAVANSLDPHFIKNSLNWIQTKFSEDDQVVDLVGRLSENIDVIFNHTQARTVFHSLREEFRLTENFLAIQRAIYGDFFELTFPSEEEIRPWADVQVPLLQVEIHVENAVEHGLRNKMGSRRLVVELEEDARHLVIRITDNGIGRKKAMSLRRGSSSRGTNLIQDIYDIYNPVNVDRFEQHYEDLVDPATGEPAGTRVVIRIPKSYNTILHETDPLPDPRR